MTLTLLPPSLPLSLPPSSLNHLLFPLFSGCSKCLETAVGAGTGPGGWPHQGTVGRGSCQARRHRALRSRRAGRLTHQGGQMFVWWGARCACATLAYCKSSALQAGPSSAPSPFTHTHPKSALNIFPPIGIISRRIHLHAVHPCQCSIVCMMSITTKAQSLQERGLFSTLSSPDSLSPPQ